MRVLKWDVPVDGKWHRVGGGPAALVGFQGYTGLNQMIQVWTLERDVFPRRAVKVYGTGDDVPDDLIHLGSTQAGIYVWHLFAEPV